MIKAYMVEWKDENGRVYREMNYFRTVIAAIDFALNKKEQRKFYINPVVFDYGLADDMWAFQEKLRMLDDVPEIYRPK